MIVWTQKCFLWPGFYRNTLGPPPVLYMRAADEVVDSPIQMVSVLGVDPLLIRIIQNAAHNKSFT